jgi:hypothetical protein
MESTLIRENLMNPYVAAHCPPLFANGLSKHLNETLKIHASLFDEPLMIDAEMIEFMKLHDRFGAKHMECSFKVDGDTILSQDRYQIYFRAYHQDIRDAFFNLSECHGPYMKKSFEEHLAGYDDWDFDRIVAGVDRNNNSTKYQYWMEFKDGSRFYNQMRAFSSFNLPLLPAGSPWFRNLVFSATVSDTGDECVRVYLVVTGSDFDSFAKLFGIEERFRPVVSASRSVYLCLGDVGERVLHVAPADFRSFVEEFEPRSLFRTIVRSLNPGIDSAAAYVAYRLSPYAADQRAFYY